MSYTYLKNKSIASKEYMNYFFILEIIKSKIKKKQITNS